MRRNLATGLRRSVHAAPMTQFDRLPPELRRWLAQAALPWSPRSALRLWQRALAQTGCVRAAIGRLDAAQARMLARDAAGIWGGDPAQADLARIPRQGSAPRNSV